MSRSRSPSSPRGIVVPVDGKSTGRSKKRSRSPSRSRDHRRSRYRSSRSRSPVSRRRDSQGSSRTSRTDRRSPRSRSPRGRRHSSSSRRGRPTSKSPRRRERNQSVSPARQPRPPRSPSHREREEKKSDESQASSSSAGVGLVTYPQTTVSRALQTSDETAQVRTLASDKPQDGSSGSPRGDELPSASALRERIMARHVVMSDEKLDVNSWHRPGNSSGTSVRDRLGSAGRSEAGSVRESVRDRLGSAGRSEAGSGRDRLGSAGRSEAGSVRDRLGSAGRSEAGSVRDRLGSGGQYRDERSSYGRRDGSSGRRYSDSQAQGSRVVLQSPRPQDVPRTFLQDDRDHYRDSETRRPWKRSNSPTMWSHDLFQADDDDDDDNDGGNQRSQADAGDGDVRVFSIDR